MPNAAHEMSKCRITLFLILTFCCIVPASAQGKVLQLRERLATETADSSRMMLYFDLSLALEMDDPWGSLEAANKAGVLARDLGNEQLMAEAENYKGNCFYNLSMYPEALRHYQRYVEMSREGNDERRVASAWTNIGILHEEMGDMEQAILCHHRSLRIKERLNDVDGTGRSHHNLGYAYQANNDHTKALKHFQAGLRIRTGQRDKAGIMSSMTRIAGSYQFLGQPDTAMIILERCFALATEMGDDEREATLLFMKADFFLDADDVDAAEQCVEQVLRLEQINGRAKQVGEAYLFLGDIAMEQVLFKKAIGHYMRALDIAEQVRSVRLRTKTLNGLMKAHRGARDLEATFRYKDLFLESQDSLRELRDRESFHGILLGQSFRSEHVADSLRHAAALTKVQNQHTIEQLRADRNRNRALFIGGGALMLFAGGGAWFYTDRKRRKERFEKESATLETQALRSQMNPHFIFNALNSINAFVQKNDPDNATSFLTKFAKVMRGVLENSRHSEVPLQDDLDTLRGYMDLERKRMGEQFDFTIEVDPAIDPEEVMVPPLVVQPFVENAIWHGMKDREDKGHITLRVKQEGAQLVWHIEDDGVGRQAKTGPTPDSSPGQPVKKTSLGTAITRSRLDLVQKQHGGKAGFRYEDLPRGTRVIVEMPLLLG